ncbi:MAG TPA: hypothetical protein VLA28_07060, partial [Afifellaceae bacterium]|nr:hypothetical protein [Afifellaceae bacterium]
PEKVWRFMENHPTTRTKTGRLWDTMGFHGSSMDSIGIFRLFRQICRQLPRRGVAHYRPPPMPMMVAWCLHYRKDGVLRPRS